MNVYNYLKFNPLLNTVDLFSPEKKKLSWLFDEWTILFAVPLT